MAVDMTQGGQFALIPAKVLYDDQLPATAKLLYGEIYRLSHANGYCYASNRDFMTICRCSEATVSRLIASLVEQKHIRVKMIRRNGTSGDIVQRRIFCGLELAQNDPEEDAGGILKNEDTYPQNCGHRVLKNEDPTIKKKNNNITPISPEDLLAEVETYANGDTELQKAIEDLLDNRTALRNPVKTMQALHGILNKLDRLAKGNRAAKLLMLENAVTHNWVTVYPLKEDELKTIQGSAGGEEDWDVVC